MQISDFVLQRGNIGFHAITEILNIVLPTQFELKTFVADIACIQRRSRIASHQRSFDAGHNKVLGFLIEIVRTKTQTVAEHAQVDTDIQLLGSFPLQFIITNG